jgi:hypothetical protein
MPRLNISNDFFIRTSDPRHGARVQEVLARVRENGYVFEGTYEGDGVVSVNHGNAHVRHADLIGDVTFDLSAARLSVADTNADTVIDPTDVLVDDHVVVKARLPRQDPTVDPSVAARQLVDQTNPGDDGIDEDTESSDESTDTD